MIDLKVQVEIKGKLLKDLINRPEGVMTKSIWAGMVNLVEEIEARGKEEAPVKTSNLRRHIVSSVSADGKKGIVTSQAPYSEYVHRGTGLFGPFHTKIKPKIKKALFWPGAEHPYKSVKGMKPNPFFTRALEKTKSQKVFEEGIWGYLKSLGG